MKALYITLHTVRKLLIFPDTIAHLNGHTIITKGYAIFKDSGVNTEELLQAKQSEELLEPIDDPDYLGRLQFDLPDKLFSYASGKENGLDAEEVNELIEMLSGIRNDPRLWH